MHRASRYKPMLSTGCTSTSALPRPGGLQSTLPMLCRLPASRRTSSTLPPGWLDKKRSGGCAPLLEERTASSVSIPFLVLASALEGARRALDASEVSAAVQHLLTVVGLGPGLTPSGDDMLLGLLGALHMAEASYRRKWSWLRDLRQGLAERCQAGRTTQLSHQWINAATAGEVPQRLSEVLCALLKAGGALAV